MFFILGRVGHYALDRLVVKFAIFQTSNYFSYFDTSKTFQTTAALETGKIDDLKCVISSVPNNERPLTTTASVPAWGWVGSVFCWVDSVFCGVGTIIWTFPR